MTSYNIPLQKPDLLKVSFNPTRTTTEQLLTGQVSTASSAEKTSQPQAIAKRLVHEVHQVQQLETIPST